ncbi:rad-23, partial [Pristionchus pacificus]
FKLELQPSDKIADVKAKIAELRGDAADLQKLLYNGKVLADESTVEECTLDPARFVVLMVTKKAAAVPTAVPPTETAPAVPPLSAPAASTPATAPSSAPADASALTAEQESAVQAIMSMGFGREGAIAALQAANFNADAAVDFLMGGEEGGAPMGGGGRAADIAPGVIEAASGRRQNPGVGLLRGLPQFDEIRRLVRENPQLLPELLTQVGQANPQLMQIIQQDPAAFAAILNEPDDIAAGGNPEEDLRNRGVASIRVTPQENEAIERLKMMGFPEALVVEAFFACDKNEDLAVNYILQRMDEAADAFNE